MTVICFYDFVEKFIEGAVSIMWTSIQTDARIQVFHTWKDTCFKCDTRFAWFIFVFVPDLLSQILAQKWFCIRFEKACKILKFLWWIVLLKRWCICLCFLSLCASSTSCSTSCISATERSGTCLCLSLFIIGTTSICILLWCIRNSCVFMLHLLSHISWSCLLRNGSAT